MTDAPLLDRAPGGPCAYVTLVTNADYLPGAVALVNSLRRSGTTADVVVLHTGGVDPAALAPLAERGARLEVQSYHRETRKRHARGA